MSGYGQSSAGGSANVPNPLPVSYPALLTAVMAVTAAVVGLGISNGTVDVGNDGSNPVPVHTSDTLTVTCTNCGGGGVEYFAGFKSDSVYAIRVTQGPHSGNFYVLPVRPGSSKSTTTVTSGNFSVLEGQWGIYLWPQSSGKIRLARLNIGFSTFSETALPRFSCTDAAEGKRHPLPTWTNPTPEDLSSGPCLPLLLEAS